MTTGARGWSGCALVVPGDSFRKLERASSTLADEIVLDLEDAVKPGRKAVARAMVIELLKDRSRFAAGRVSVRINDLGSAYAEDDVHDLVSSGVRIDSLVIPKVESVDQVTALEAALRQPKSCNDWTLGGLRLQVMIESPAGLLAVERLIDASHLIEAVIFGPLDFAASMGPRVRAVSSPSSASYWVQAHARSRIVTAAKAAGVAAIDGPVMQLGDEERVRTSACEAAEWGFDGQWAIHPDHVAVCRAAFLPTPEEVQWARQVISALGDLPEEGANGSGAVALNGVMLDHASWTKARRVLEAAPKTSDTEDEGG